MVEIQITLQDGHHLVKIMKFIVDFLLHSVQKLVLEKLISKWQIYCSGPEFTRPNFILEICTCRENWRLARMIDYQVS